jgi:hypothetical protein
MASRENKLDNDTGPAYCPHVCALGCGAALAVGVFISYPGKNNFYFLSDKTVPSMHTNFWESMLLPVVSCRFCWKRAGIELSVISKGVLILAKCVPRPCGLPSPTQHLRWVYIVQT